MSNPFESMLIQCWIRQTSLILTPRRHSKGLRVFCLGKQCFLKVKVLLGMVFSARVGRRCFLLWWEGVFLQRSTVYGSMGGIARLLKLQDQKTCILRLHDIMRLSLLSPLSSLSLSLQKKCVSINQINPAINQSIYLSVGLPIYLSFCLYLKYQHAGILS